MNTTHTTKYLDRIDSPSQLKALTLDELVIYCAELREFIIEQVSLNPGHLGSSLGALELAVAVHYVYDTPVDKLIWDVGHQAYAHKIITGRRDLFHTNRTLGGISGFPKMSESPYDAFGVGHSSTSISAALGMSIASSLLGTKNHSIAIIGDGSMSCGLAFEGLNNAGAWGGDLLVILNDNKIAIDPNVGALKEYLLGLTTSERYNRMKAKAWQAMEHTPRFRRIVQKIGHGAKSFFLHQSNLFESFNFRYFGPVDGNDVKALVRALGDLKNINGPKLLHTLTVKGKGYTPAEENQTAWHAPGLFDSSTGEKIVNKSDTLRYQDVFGHTLVELAHQNPRIVGITPAMPTGCSMNLMMEALPDRAFDVGIAEGHAVVMAAGMAASGLVPFCNIYSSFMQRAVDNVIHDVALQKLEVILPLDRAGIVGQDGATHHGIFDIALLRPIPNLIIGAPASAAELRDMMYTASLGGYGAAFVIRYPRGGKFPSTNWQTPFAGMEIGRSVELLQGHKLAILSLGEMVAHCAKAIELASEKSQSQLSIAHYNLLFAKPLDNRMLDEVCQQFDTIIVAEDGVLAGGVGSAILEFISDRGYGCKVRRIGISDYFPEHGTPEELYRLCGMDAESISRVILDNYR